MKSYEKNQLLDALRVIATLLVVIGHCSFYTISTSIDTMGVDWTRMIIDESNAHRLCVLITQLIYTSHMQLFMFISGAVFAICIKRGKYQSLKDLHQKKAKRLLIPYLVVSVFYCCPILWLSGYYSNSFTNVCLYILGYGKNHLWFLVCLYEIFIVSFSLRSICDKTFVKNKKNLVLLGVSFCLYFFSEILNNHITETLYLDRLFVYWMWFEIGACSLEYLCKLELKGTIYLIGCTSFAGITWIACFFLTRQGVLRISLLQELTGVFFWVFFASSYLLVKNRWGHKYLFDYLNRKSMDIYLYGVPVNYVIITVLLVFNKNEIIQLHNCSSTFLVVTRFFLQILVALIIALIVAIVRKQADTINPSLKQ